MINIHHGTFYILHFAPKRMPQSHPYADVLRLPIPEIVHSSYGDQKEGDVFVLENLLAAGFRGFKEVRTNQRAASGHVITVLISDWRATPVTRT